MKTMNEAIDAVRGVWPSLSWAPLADEPGRRGVVAALPGGGSIEVTWFDTQEWHDAHPGVLDRLMETDPFMDPTLRSSVKVHVRWPCGRLQQGAEIQGEALEGLPHQLVANILRWGLLTQWVPQSMRRARQVARAVTPKSEEVGS